MRILTFSTSDQAPRVGLLVGDRVVPLPYKDVLEIIRGSDPISDRIRKLVRARQTGPLSSIRTDATPTEGYLSLSGVKVHPPIFWPPTLRDFCAFEQHIANTRANQEQPIPPEWYAFPAYYFSSPTALYGQGDEIPYPKISEALDYELEIACIIGREGRDIPPEQAEEYIFGFMIFNDWSARDVESQELRIGLGPAKSKDFASSMGPWIITLDELSDRTTGRPGVYDLEMVARINGVVRSRGNLKDIFYSFGQLIARASTDVTLYPGEIIASGTVGSGCLLELTQGKGPWLQPGDLVELEVERMGCLTNRIGKKG